MAKKPKKWAKVVPGHLYGWSKTQSDARRHATLNVAVKKDSYATIVRRLNQLRNLTKDIGTKTIVKKDMAYLKEKYRK